MIRIVLSGLLLLALGALAAKNNGCTPDEWEGGSGSLGGYDHFRHTGMIKERTKISYDATNKRIATSIHYENNRYSNDFKMVVIYGKGVNDGGMVYILDVNKNKCWSKKIHKPFMGCCIPADAKHRYDYTIGIAGQGGLPVEAWTIKKKEVDVYLLVTKLGDAIIPVSEYIEGDIWGTKFLQAMGYGDITPGIKNATVFDIPSQCKETSSLNGLGTGDLMFGPETRPSDFDSLLRRPYQSDSTFLTMLGFPLSFTKEEPDMSISESLMRRYSILGI